MVNINQQQVIGLNRTGVILAAGFGSRLSGTVEKTDLKPLTPVAGEPLIFRTIDSLELAGCNRVVIVLGHGYEEIRQSIVDVYYGNVELEFVFNEDYELSNGVSLMAARPKIDGQFILTMADHVLGDDMMTMAAQHQPPKNGATLLVDYKVDSIFDINDATKVQSIQDELISIGKKIESYNCIDTGVFIGTEGLLDAIQEVYKQNGDASLSEGVQKLAAKDRMKTLDIKDGFWQDVDTPAMLEYAETKLEEKTVTD